MCSRCDATSVNNLIWFLQAAFSFTISSEIDDEDTKKQSDKEESEKEESDKDEVDYKYCGGILR